MGYATLLPAYDTAYAWRGFYVGDLYVAPRARRHGAGRALIAAAAAEAKRRGGSYLWWASEPDNRRAHAFYRSLGAGAETVRAHSLEGGAFRALAAEGRGARRGGGRTR